MANAMEGNAASLWFTGCVAGGLAFIAIGARAGGLAILGALVGSFIGVIVTSDFDQLPQGAMVGASVGTFVAGLAGLAWRSWASPSALCVLGSATIFIGVATGWAAYSQACDGYWEKRCLPEVGTESLALFALDAVWVAALCFIQAAQSNRAMRSSVSASRADVADASR